jgi:MoaA/NifB/PqqE/SkfB family radical SAM enzyme
MDFPKSISFTITNVCNLRCQMCGQWSAEGYMHHNKDHIKDELALADWKRLVDELAEHQIPSVLLRGGEPFLFPDIMELLRYINRKGIFLSIDTNGTMLKNYANEIVALGRVHLTISVDGPEEIHDQVRGVKGCFQRIKENVASLLEAESSSGQTISKSICFTISPYSYKGLGQMPDVARELGLGSLVIVPYYYVPDHLGKEYEKELKELSSPAFSWHGFHHEDSGVDFEIFQQEYRKFLAGLGDISSFPYLPLSEEEYRTWFTDPIAMVRKESCSNVEKLMDIQPNGNANFCVDFPDYCFGNVKEATISELWNSEQAERFREYRRKKQLAVCYRCGAKYMAEIEG